MTKAQARVAYVGLGSNLDEPGRRVLAAFDALARLPTTQVLRRSRLFRTPPWGNADQPVFVNAVAELSTRLAPRELLDALLGIEREQGRHRDGTRWGPRVLDLDLLIHGDARIDEPNLRVPHAHVAERAFVLLPLADIDPHIDVPGQGRVDALLARVDTSGCIPLD
jgi:2-amino-4-hydroxy-6-hydroxymethyldihydropteridine diphosphokinase